MNINFKPGTGIHAYKNYITSISCYLFPCERSGKHFPEAVSIVKKYLKQIIK